MKFSGQLSAEEFWARASEMDDRVRNAFTGLSFPCLGLAEWPGTVMLGNWEWRNGELTFVGLMHGAVEAGQPGVHVLTTSDDPYLLARAGHISGRAAPRTKEEFEQRLREPRSSGDAVTKMRLNSAEVDVEVRPTADGWVAVAALQGYGVVVQGHGLPVEQIALAQVSDIEPYIQGRREEIARRRGEL